MLNRIQYDSICRRAAEVSPLKIIMPLAVVACCCVAMLHGVDMDNNDTPSYLLAGENFLHGKVDAMRPPVYSLLLVAMRGLMGNAYGYGMVALQYAAFLASIVVFHRVLDMLRLSRGAHLLALAAYALFPGYLGFLAIAVPEGLSLVGVVMMTHALLLLLRADRVRVASVLYFAISMIVLVLTKPGFVHLPATMVVMGLLLACSHTWRSAGVKLLCAGGIASMVVLGYMGLYKMQHGVFTLSNVNTLNQYHVLRHKGMLLPEEVTDSALRVRMLHAVPNDVIESEFPDRSPHKDTIWYESYYTLRDNGIAAVRPLVLEQMKEHRTELMLLTGDRIVDSSYEQLPSEGYAAKHSYVLAFFNKVIFSGVTIGLIYRLVAIYLAVILFQWWRRKRMPLVAVMLLATVCGGLATIILGSYSDFGRLFLPLSPIALLMLAQLCNQLRLKPHGERGL